MQQFERRIRAVIERYAMIRPGESVLAGVSGGADSVCLLEVLAVLRETMGFTLAAVHVDHGMRENAGRDAEFTEALCRRKGVACIVKHADVPAAQRAWRCSPEEAARRARYAAFAEAMEEMHAGCVAVAHHRDDQAETVLHNLFRGAGMNGMAGMAPVHELRDADTMMRVIRPLLYVSREEIRAYLAEKGLTHVEDETNGTDHYERNRIRRHILPYAEEQINAAAAAHLAQAADRAREALSWAEEERDRRYPDIVQNLPEGGVRIDLAALRAEHGYLQKLILLRALPEAGIRRQTEEVHLDALLGFIAGEAGSASLDLPEGYRAQRSYDSLRISRAGTAPEAEEIPVVLPPEGGETEAVLPDGSRVLFSVMPCDVSGTAEIPADPFTKWFDFDTIKRPVCVRGRRRGDVIDVGNVVKKLSREMIDRRIPAPERDRVPLLAAGDEILWIVGVRRCETHRVHETTGRILQVRYLPGSGQP